MMDPPPRVSMPRMACLTVRNAPVRLMPMVSFQAARSRSAILASRPKSCTPALATTTSGVQPASARSENAVSSPVSPQVPPPAGRAAAPISAAVARAPCSSRSAITPRAPSRANRCATAAPIPDPAPVISAVLFSRRGIRAPPRCSSSPVGRSSPVGQALFVICALLVIRALVLSASAEALLPPGRPVPKPPPVETPAADSSPFDAVQVQHPGQVLVQFLVAEDLLPVVLDDGLAPVVHRDQAGVAEGVVPAQPVGQCHLGVPVQDGPGGVLGYARGG